jgi:2-oxo-4-hydroxy-4-carboxy-5-ureidoimidazoline decarboxylase
MARARLSREGLMRLERDRFVELFGGVFEHSPWVAEDACQAGPFATLEALHAAMVDAMRRAPREKQLALIRAHPDLAGRAAIGGGLSAASSAEQASAGLDQCTPAEFDRFRALNGKYRRKFHFPFIMAVKGKRREQILAAFERRLNNSAQVEFAEALDQIAEIARLRLAELIRA